MTQAAAPASSPSPKTPAVPAREPYLGSVRFFKHIFLGILILMILVPTVTSIVLGVRLAGVRAEQERLTEELVALKNAEQMIPAVVEMDLAPEPEPEPAPTPAEPGFTLPYETESPAYTQLYPDFYAPEAAWSSIDQEKTCYLTFDDGPSPRTEEVLDILARENIQATFFVTRQTSEDNQRRLRAVAEAGHTVGLHSSSHDYKLIYSSVEAFLEDYYQLFTWVREVTGEAPAVFRFPGGSINGYNHALYREIIAEMTRRGFVYFDWNISSGDAASPGPTAQQITDNCLTGLHKLKRSVVLMHDSASHANTVAALPAIIRGYREQGFTFAPLTPEVKPVVFGYRDFQG